MLSDSADPALSHPITGIGCSAGAANGQASAQPAMRARNSRRRICPFFAKSGAESLADALRRFLENLEADQGAAKSQSLASGCQAPDLNSLPPRVVPQQIAATSGRYRRDSVTVMRRGEGPLTTLCGHSLTPTATVRSAPRRH